MMPEHLQDQEPIEVAPGIIGRPINPLLEARWRVAPETFRAAKLILVAVGESDLHDGVLMLGYVFLAPQGSIELLPAFQLVATISPSLSAEGRTLAPQLEQLRELLGCDAVEHGSKSEVDADIRAWRRRVADGTADDAMALAKAWNLPRLTDAIRESYGLTGLGAKLPDTFGRR